MPVRQHAPEVWSIAHPFRVGGLDLGARTTVVRLHDGQLALHSPGPLGDDDAAAIGQLGRVGLILAPNLLHHRFIADARRRFPDARLVAPAGLADKRRDLVVDLPLALDQAHAPALPQLDDTLAPIAIAGMPKLDEIVWLHRPSKTLLVGDLVFNLRPPRPWLTRTVMKLNGAWDRFGPSKIFRRLVRDRAALRRGVEQILQHDFERVMVVHGEVLEENARAALRDAFAWLLSAA